MSTALDVIATNPLYVALLVFFAGYPLVSAVVWIVTAGTYHWRRERSGSPVVTSDAVPRVSVLVPAYNEEARVRETVDSCLALDYPDFEVVVVDDGSTDGTLAAVADLVESGQVRCVRKEANEGKALALNDAIPCLTGELLLIVDADARPEPDLLRHLVPHFASARVAAVTGNPRVVERHTLLAKLQAMEFTSIISLLRRAQRVWGRILTVSGVVVMFRVSALADVGLFSPDMATEDIDVTWKLQKRFYDVRYEPKAVVWMRVPTTLPQLWRQRRRWARGLGEVLRRHGAEVLFDWRRRRMWPVVLEALLSVAWALSLVTLLTLWGISLAMGRPLPGVQQLPNLWGMVIASLALVQLAVGTALDRRYDRGLLRDLPVAVLYPLGYWVLMAFITVVTTPRAMLTRGDRKPARWHSVRPT